MLCVNKRLLFLIIPLLLAVFLPCAFSATVSMIGHTENNGEILVKGLKRSYHVHTPSSIRGRAKVPLVIMLHGGAGNWRGIRRISGMNAKADQAGFIVAYPNGTGRLKSFLFWNATDCCGYPLSHNVDDVSFIDKLIEQLKARYPVDSERVYIVGYSNGAMMAYRIGCELTKKIAAIGIIGGSMSGREKLPNIPLPVVIFHGTKDRHVPYYGGGGKWERWGYPVNREPVSYACSFWRRVNGCSGTPLKLDSKDVHKEIYFGIGEVELVTIDGTGHSWPGGRKMDWFSDYPYPSLNATDECWEFLSRHKRQTIYTEEEKMNKPYEWTMLSALGGEMLEVRPGYARGRLPLSDEVKQPTGVFHAGAIVTLADEVASAAIQGGSITPEMLKTKLFPYSVQLSVNLITNDPQGPLTAESNVARQGGLTIVDTEVTTADGKVAALMRSVHKMVNLEKEGPHRKR